ncbi:MAG: c-type cytochrome [Myxococcales bacterium]|nr:c-type cytochrome [Myxococcales bacterium]
MSDKTNAERAAEANIEHEKLLEHEYDGIREYDNPLPSWWTGIFIATIFFSVGYLIWYHGGGPGKSEHDEYRAEVAEYIKRAAAAAAKAGPVTVGSLKKLAANTALMGTTQATFTKHCVVCHGSQGQGKIGPNLTDNYQIHGTTIVDLFNTILNGVPAKGMIAWGKVLKRHEVMSLAAYVFKLRGTNVKGGKAKEGKEVASAK